MFVFVFISTIAKVITFSQKSKTNKQNDNVKFMQLRNSANESNVSRLITLLRCSILFYNIIFISPLHPFSADMEHEQNKRHIEKNCLSSSSQITVNDTTESYIKHPSCRVLSPLYFFLFLRTHFNWKHTVKVSDTSFIVGCDGKSWKNHGKARAGHYLGKA